MRKCSTCKNAYLLDEFPWANKRENRKRHECKKCLIIRVKTYNSQNKEKVGASRKKMRSDILLKLHQYKESFPCTDCGEYFPHYVMDFDHQKDKIGNISLLAQRYSWNRLLTEIEKCEIVCANCHRARTFRAYSLTEEC